VGSAVGSLSGAGGEAQAEIEKRASSMCYCSGRMDFNYALIDCVHVYGLLLGFYADDAFVLLFYLLSI